MQQHRQHRVGGGSAAVHTHRTAGRTEQKAVFCHQRKQRNGTVAQLVVCGGLFVLLVITKVFLPGSMNRLSGQLQEAMHHNIDMQAVFMAAGKALSDGPNHELPEAGFAEPISAQPDSALDFLRQFQHWEESTQSEKAVAALAPVPYFTENLPENVCMEQKLLGFTYGAPLKGSISSSFGYRQHPTKGEERFHYGIDLAAEQGTDIQSFAEGTVTAVGESSSYGKYCTVAHPNGYESLYAHCDAIRVSAGEKVQQGTVLGKVGHSGMATSDHLHFELHQNNIFLNPVYYIE